jgi:hypothetical protein
MSGVAAAANYKTEIRPTSSGDDQGQLARASNRPTPPIDGARGPAVKTASPVEDCLKLLARALQYFHTYPANSPMCVDAVTTCHAALGRVPGNERLVFVVEPRELRAGELKIGAGTVIEHELASRLHGARVSTIEIDRAASIRDLSRFCEDLHAPRGEEGTPTLAEMLVEHGVDRIVLTMAHRPEVLHIGSPVAARTRVLEQERGRRESGSVADGPSIHLYPPDIGWIRTDPGVELGSVSLPDLAILVDDPTTLATMLLRLADDGPEGSAVTPATALERKFSDVTKLFSVLEPRLARVMFAKLAGAVLSLDTNRRQNLLQKTVLPGLLDGEPDGAVLQDFPDVDLADALSLLLDVETAAPELLATALNRLELTAERRESMATLLEERVRTRLGAGSAGRGGESALDQRIRQLIRVSAGGCKSFEEFCAYDLSIDGATAEVIARVGPAILETDLLGKRLECAFHLVRLEPSPVLVERLLRPALQMFLELERAGRLDEVTTSLTRLARLVDELRNPRPDVADAISAALETYFDSARIGRLLAMHEAGGTERAAAAAIVTAVGTGLATPLFERLKAAERHTLERSLTQLLCDQASILAPGLVKHVGEGTPSATAVLVRVLGFAGPGYEEAISSQLAHPDDAVVREALRALARIGSDAAASAVGAVVRQGVARTQGLAEEALWHFPPEQARAQLLELLGHRAFVMASPKTVGRLIDRAGRSRDHGLEQVLTDLRPLRFRFWNPALRRVGARAHALLQPS